MEAHLASQEPLLIDNLNFVPSHSADYVINRKKQLFIKLDLIFIQQVVAQEF